ncbi:hypothetical protein CRUP_002348 [Coryphaenoides rupestris]|nr:hypothetical protein CRUP_002348 [Coryphaenoides rupestris]
MKSMDAQGAGLEPANQEQPATPKRKPGSERALACPPDCLHGAPLPSDVLIEMKEVLSVGVGPRTEAELPTAPQLRSLLVRFLTPVSEQMLLRSTFLTPVSEQMLLRSTVLLACQTLDGGRLAVQVEDKYVRVRNVKKLLEFGFDYCYWSVDADDPQYASQEEAAGPVSARPVSLKSAARPPV